MIIMHRFFLGKFRINGFIIVFTFLWSIDVMVNIPFMVSGKQADKGLVAMATNMAVS